MKRIVGFLLCVVLLFSLCGCNSQDYEKAIDLMRSEDFASAKVIFDKLGDYKDSAQKSQSCTYSMAMLAYNEGGYEEARAGFSQIGDYKDAGTMCIKCDYHIAMLAYNDGRYEEAKAGFSQIEDYKDAGTMCVKCDYRLAIELLDSGAYTEAHAAFEALGDYEDSAEYANQAKWGMLYLYIEENGEYDTDLGYNVLCAKIAENTHLYLCGVNPNEMYLVSVCDASTGAIQWTKKLVVMIHRGNNEAEWGYQNYFSFMGAYNKAQLDGTVSIDTCTSKTTLKPETILSEILDASGNYTVSWSANSVETETANLNEVAWPQLLEALSAVLTETGLPIEMKDLGFLALK